LGGLLSQDASTKIHALPGGKWIVKQKTTLAFADYEISVDEQSWINAPQDMQSMKATFIIAPQLSALIVEDAKKMFAEDPDAQHSGEKPNVLESVASAAAPWLTDIVAAGLMDDQKRLVVPYRSKGKLSDPKIDFGGLWNDL